MGEEYGKDSFTDSFTLDTFESDPDLQQQLGRTRGRCCCLGDFTSLFVVKPELRPDGKALQVLLLSSSYRSHQPSYVINRSLGMLRTRQQQPRHQHLENIIQSHHLQR